MVAACRACSVPTIATIASRTGAVRRMLTEPPLARRASQVALRTGTPHFVLRTHFALRTSHFALGDSLSCTSKVTPAIDRDGLSGHPRGTFRGQEKDERRNLRRLTRPSQWVRLLRSDEERGIVLFIHTA